MEPDARPTLARPVRTGMPVRGALVVLAVALLGWTLLAAPDLRRAAEAQPPGARRTAALAVLAPFAWVARTSGLAVLAEGAARALGRVPTGVGAPLVPPDDLPTVSTPPNATPSPPPRTDTPIRTPSPRDRLRVAVVGDSLAAGLGYFAERVFRPGLVDVTKQGRISTGLARPDYFDWPAALRRIVRAFRPDLVIVMIGENDQQFLRTRSGTVEAELGSPGWAPAYEMRVEGFAQTATARGAHVIWVGLPVERDASRWPFLRRQNAIFERVAGRLPNVAFLDAWDLFDRPDGSYTAYLRKGGRVELVREADSVHFTPAGYTILMDHIARLATEAFDLSPRAYERPRP